MGPPVMGTIPIVKTPPTLMVCSLSVLSGRRARLTANLTVRRPWWKFRMGRNSFHGSTLHGNLVRLLILFHFPITTYSCYQLTLDSSIASITSKALAALSFAFLSVLIPSWLLFRVATTSTSKLYDATRTLLALGPLYNEYQHESQLFAGMMFAANLCLGVVVGCGQQSGTAQAIIILVVEVVVTLSSSIWLPWMHGAQMGVISFIFCVARIIAAVLMVILARPVCASTRFLGRLLTSLSRWTSEIKQEDGSHILSWLSKALSSRRSP